MLARARRTHLKKQQRLALREALSLIELSSRAKLCAEPEKPAIYFAA